MKRILLTTVCLLPAFLLLAQEPAQKEKARTLPSVDVKTPEGKNVNTSMIANDGKPIVICFWATWCKPCIEELNAINEEYDTWKKETGMKVIAVSLDDARTMNRVAPFVNGKGWEYEVLVDPNFDFKRAMNVNNPPHSFILNKNREIVWNHVSYSPGDEKKMYEVVKAVAEGKPVTH